MVGRAASTRTGGAGRAARIGGSRADGAMVAGEERWSILRLVILLQLELLQKNVRASAYEGMGLVGEYRLDVTKFLVQPA